MVFIHLAEGFEETEAVTVMDVLRRAGIEAAFVSVPGGEKDMTVSGAHGVKIKADMDFADADYEKCEMIVLPGGMTGTLNLNKHDGLCSRIREFARNDKWLCAICAAPMILASLSVLEDKKAVIYPGLEKKLKGARIYKTPVVKDGKVITGRSPGTAMLFSLEIVKALKGQDIMEKVKAGLAM